MSVKWGLSAQNLLLSDGKLIHKYIVLEKSLLQMLPIKPGNQNYIINFISLLILQTIDIVICPSTLPRDDDAKLIKQFIEFKSSCNKRKINSKSKINW